MSQRPSVLGAVFVNETVANQHACIRYHELFLELFYPAAVESMEGAPSERCEASPEPSPGSPEVETGGALDGSMRPHRRALAAPVDASHP